MFGWLDVTTLPAYAAKFAVEVVPIKLLATILPDTVNILVVLLYVKPASPPKLPSLLNLLVFRH